MFDESKLITISPHYDDAVFSCGNLLAGRPGGTVLTVFTGAPPDAAHVTTDWDRRCGFKNAQDAVMARDAENEDALRLLRQHAVKLNLLDRQYHAEVREDQIAEKLADSLSELSPRVVLIPLGMFHGDHMRVSDAALRIRGVFRHCVWLAYEDVPYRDKPGLLQARLAALMNRQVHATPAGIEPKPSPIKLRAVEAYRSQIQELSRLADAHAGIGSTYERYWNLTSG